VPTVIAAAPADIIAAVTNKGVEIISPTNPVLRIKVKAIAQCTIAHGIAKTVQAFAKFTRFLCFIDNSIYTRVNFVKLFLEHNFSTNFSDFYP